MLNDIISWRSLTVFLFAILVDIAWGFYIRRAGTGHAVKAANWAVGIMLFGVFNTISWLENRWMLVPMYTGAWIGTFAVVKWDHRKDKQKSVPAVPVE